MSRIIEKREQVIKAVNRFRQLIKENSSELEKRKWIFPNGYQCNLDTYLLKTSYGDLYVGIENKWDKKIPHQFALDPEKGQILLPNVEINIPLEIDRRISGVYVEHNNDIWLCSRGHLNVYRGRIKKNIVLKYFEKWLVETQDGSKLSQLIPIAALSSPDPSTQIALFVSEVKELKERHKNNKAKIITAISSVTWNEGDEFAGKKKGKSSQSFDYEYLHGPICNQLKEYLLEIISQEQGYEVKRNRNIDAAIIKENLAFAIFEVKTSSSITDQAAKGIGQLFYYRQVYGNDNSKLYLIVPHDDNSKLNDLYELTKKLGINLILYNTENGKFKCFNGTSLKELMKKQQFA